MLHTDDFLQMRRDMRALRDDLPVSVVIRRGGISLAAQPVRIVVKQGSKQDGSTTETSRGSVLVMGEIVLDIQADDRFTVDGALYVVKFVYPNRTVRTLALAEVTQ